jgi:copper oxidase (laccase) domain-containing protein
MYQSRLLLHHPELFHAFLTKEDSIDGLGLPFLKSKMRVPKQIHSEIVVLWEKIKDTTEADAVVFSNIGVSGVKTADCIPIFLYDPDLKIASVIHAGWQGPTVWC